MKTIHFGRHGLTNYIFDWTDEPEGYANKWYVSRGGGLVESHTTRGRAEFYAERSDEFYRKHGIENPSTVWRFVWGIGFLRVSQG